MLAHRARKGSRSFTTARQGTLHRAPKLARSRRSRVRQPGAIKDRLSCGVCSGSQTDIEGKLQQQQPASERSRYQHPAHCGRTKRRCAAGADRIYLAQAPLLSSDNGTWGDQEVQQWRLGESPAGSGNNYVPYHPSVETPDEVVALAQACRGPYAELIYVLAMQGLRWGELAGLQVGDR